MSDELKSQISRMRDGQIRRIVKHGVSHLGEDAVRYAKEEFDTRDLTIEEGDHTHNPRNAISPRETSGISAQALGLILSILFLLFWLSFWMVLPKNAEAAPANSAIQVWIIPIGVNLLMFFSVRYGLLRKRRKALQSQYLIPQPSTYKDHVLYLRAFVADDDASNVIGSSTEEEHLALVFGQVGPFIAIGKPGEPLPELGAIRLYVEDPDWQSTVSDLMKGARLLVMRVGDSPGFWWEFKQALQTVQPQQVLLLVPDDPELYNRFRLKAKDYLETSFPDFFVGHRMSVLRATLGKARELYQYLAFFSGHTVSPGYFGSLRGIVYFDADSTPRKRRFGSNWFRGDFSAPAIPILVRALKPYLKQEKVKVRMPGVRLTKVFGLLITLFVWLRLIASLVLM